MIAANPVQQENYYEPRNSAIQGQAIVPFRPECDLERLLGPSERGSCSRAEMHWMDGYPVSHPLEYFFYSVISGAAMVSLLIGILSLPGSEIKPATHPTTRSEAFESSVVIPNRS